MKHFRMKNDESYIKKLICTVMFLQMFNHLICTIIKSYNKKTKTEASLWYKIEIIRRQDIYFRDSYYIKRTFSGFATKVHVSYFFDRFPLAAVFRISNKKEKNPLCKGEKMQISEGEQGHS